MKNGIVDAHVHMFPDDLPAKWNWYARRDSWFAILTEDSPKSRVKELFANAEETLKEADKAGVETIFMQGWYWNDMELCRRNNDYMYRLTQEYPGRFEAFGSTNPCFGQEMVDEVYRCYEMGFPGLGELGPGGCGFSLYDPWLYRILETAQKLRLIVNYHVGEPVGHAYPGKDRTPIEGFYDMAKAFPELVLIFAHMGGGLPVYEALPEVHDAFRNVYYDLAANPLLYDIRVVRAVADLVGADKILFGTDFPLTIYPWKCMERDFTLLIEDIRENGDLTEEELEMVLGGNSRRILAKAGKRGAEKRE